MAKQQSRTDAPASSKTKVNTKAARQEKAIDDVIAHGWRIGKITTKTEEDDVRRVMRDALKTPAQRHKEIYDEVMRKSQARDKKRQDLIARAVGKSIEQLDNSIIGMQVLLGTYMPPEKPENNEPKTSDVTNIKPKQGVLL